MKIVIIAIIISSAAAFAAASWIYKADPQQDSASAQSVTEFDSGFSGENRRAALEQAVSDERQARQWLQEEVLYLTEELELLSGGNDPEPAAAVAAAPPAEDPGSARREDYRRRYSEEGRIEALIEAGFLPSQASLIVRRESELQMDA